MAMLLFRLGTAVTLLCNNVAGSRFVATADDSDIAGVIPNGLGFE